jgi:hypothetical protein
MGRTLLSFEPKHRDYSLLCATYEARIPFTPMSRWRGHSALSSKRRWCCVGRNNPHRLSTACYDRGSNEWRRRLLETLVLQLFLPEVFLKCVTLVRNLGHPLTDITTANFDFIQSYRPKRMLCADQPTTMRAAGFQLQATTN